MTTLFLSSIIKYNYIDIRKLLKGFHAMKNINRFPYHHMFFVVPVFEVEQGYMFDGIDTILRNPDHPKEMS